MNNTSLPINTYAKMNLILIICLILFTFGFNFQGAPLFDEDEGAYACVSSEMIRNCDYLTPTLNNVPFFHKPPLFYWVQALSIKSFGFSEFSCRLPSVLASMAWAMLLFRFTSRRYGMEKGFLAAAFMATALHITIIAKAAIPDAFLNFFITGAMFAISDHLESEKRRHAITAHIFIGLGMMTKGPVAAFIPLVSSMIVYTSSGKTKLWLKAIFDPMGLAALFAIYLPWNLMMWMKHGRPFIDAIFLKHNIGRFSSAMEGHSGPFFYYIPVILAGFIPNTRLLIKAFTKTAEHWKKPDLRLMLAWFFTVFVLFSLGATKLHHYIIYGYTPIFIIMALEADRTQYGTWDWIPAGILMFFIAAIPFIIPFTTPHISDRLAREILPQIPERLCLGGILVPAIAGIIILCFGLFLKLRANSKRIITGIMLTAVIFGFIFPVLGEVQQGPVKKAALICRKSYPDVVSYRISNPSFWAYLGKPEPERKPVSGDIVFTRTINLNEFDSYEIIYKELGIVLIKIS